jgi:transposase-like protein
VHLIRNCLRYASWKDRKGIASMIRPIYTATTLEAAEMALDAFADSDPGRRCPAAVQVLRRAWTEFIPFLDYDPASAESSAPRMKSSGLVLGAAGPRGCQWATISW